MLTREGVRPGSDRFNKYKKTQSSQGAAAASKLVPILAPRWASKDGCRFRCILCAICRVKADRRGPKGHPGLAGWLCSTHSRLRFLKKPSKRDFSVLHQKWVSPHGCPRGKCNELGMPMLMLTCKRSRAWPRATTSSSWRRCSTLPSLSEARPPPLLLSPAASDRSSMHLPMRPH